MGPDNDEHVLELGPDVGDEGESTRFLKAGHVLRCSEMYLNVLERTKMFLDIIISTYLEYNCDYVVTNVSFAWKLLPEMRNNNIKTLTYS